MAAPFHNLWPKKSVAVAVVAPTSTLSAKLLLPLYGELKPAWLCTIVVN